jgi:hypothetical protein
MYQVIMLLPGAQGVQQVTLEANHLVTDPATLGSTAASLPPGESCLLLQPGAALAVAVSHLAAPETGAERTNGHEEGAEALTPLASVSAPEGGN